MKRKYLLLLVALAMALTGCGKKHFAPPPELEVQATTSCPVQIVDSWLEFYPNTRWKISGRLLSNIEKPCLVELLGCLCDQETGEPLMCNKEKFYVKDSEKTFIIWFVVGGRCLYEDLKKHPDGICNYDYTVEITGVEIKH